MAKRVEVAFKKSFSGRSENGIAFAWLKRTYGIHIDDAIVAAVRWLYLPLALSEGGASSERVGLEIERSRQAFQARMDLRDRPFPATKACPARIDHAFKKSFSEHSDNGLVFGWLKETDGSGITETTIGAVRLVYLPVALVEDWGETERGQWEVQRAQLVFEAKMTMAMGQVEGGCGPPTIPEQAAAIATVDSAVVEAQCSGREDNELDDGCIEVNLEID